MPLVLDRAPGVFGLERGEPGLGDLVGDLVYRVAVAAVRPAVGAGELLEAGEVRPCGADALGGRGVGALKVVPERREVAEARRLDCLARPRPVEAVDHVCGLGVLDRLCLAGGLGGLLHFRQGLERGLAGFLEGLVTLAADVEVSLGVERHLAPDRNAEVDVDLLPVAGESRVPCFAWGPVPTPHDL